MQKRLLNFNGHREKYFPKAHAVWFFVSFSLIVGGCATKPSSLGRPMIDIHTIQVGMSHQEVKKILGDKVVTGYEIANPAVPAGGSSDQLSQSKPITLKNPFRVEIYRTDDKVCEVAFYFTTLKQQDGVITDDELTPLVFANDRLIGRGWQFYKNFKKTAHL